MLPSWFRSAVLNLGPGVPVCIPVFTPTLIVIPEGLFIGFFLSNQGCFTLLMGIGHVKEEKNQIMHKIMELQILKIIKRLLVMKICIHSGSPGPGLKTTVLVKDEE